MAFTVLYVCTGNICRSPMAEMLFRGWADPRADVVVSSAGVQALIGHEIDASSAEPLVRLGIDPSAHRGRQVEVRMIREADLVLAATREQRDILLATEPRAMNRVFTMKEFVRLSAGVGRGDPTALIASAAGRRGRVPAPVGDEDDIRDPYRSGITHAKSIAEEITENIYATVDVLGFMAARWGHTPPAHSRRSLRPSPY